MVLQTKYNSEPCKNYLNFDFFKPNLIFYLS
jgi:hypothetical protein